MSKPPNQTMGKKGKKGKKGNHRGPSNSSQRLEPKEQHVCGLSKKAIERRQEPDVFEKCALLPIIPDLVVMQVGWPKFYIDFSAFQPLLEKSFIDWTLSANWIRQLMTFGMWQYYHTIILWKKILRILGGRGERCNEHRQMEAIVPDSLPLHYAVADYLDGIGSIQKDSFVSFAELVIQGFPADHTEFGAMGSFGRVSADNHWIYESLPSPIVALLKIKADIDYSLANDEDKTSDWDLPTDLRPLDEGATLPTANLLGWTPAENIETHIIRSLKNVNFSSTNFGVTNVGTIPVNRVLIDMVANYLEVSKSRLEKMRPGVEGSMAQIPYWKAYNLAANTANDEDCWNQTPLVNIAKKSGHMWMAPIYCEHVVAKASAFRYRLKRMTQNNYGEMNRDMLCYRFEKSSPPTAWLSNANTCWEWGTSQWNMSSQSNVVANEYTMDDYLSKLGQDAE